MDRPPPRTGSRASTLYLPLREPASAWAATLLLLLYYALSMARDLSLYDSGELALAAVQLGLGHPPGQPLHTLLGYVLSRIPLWPQLVSVALASALPAALTLVPATSLAQRLCSQDARLDRALPFALALLAVHPVLWEPATRVEVYALATFFAVWAVARLAEPQSAVIADTQRKRESIRTLLQAGLALGLCASVNSMIALCTGLAVAPSILYRLARGRLPPSALAYAVVGGVLGLVPYLYVPLVASRSDVMVWGAPRDLASFWHYVSLRDYAANQGIDSKTWIAHAIAWFGWSVPQALVPWLALGVAGHLREGKRTELGRIAGPLLLLLLVASVSSNIIFSLEVPDYYGYVATALWVLAAGAMALCARLFLEGRPASSVVIALALVTSALVAPPQVFARTRHRDRLARAIAERVLQEAPRGAVVIAETDHFAGSLFYVQQHEGLRRDVVVLAYGLASSRWHWESIFTLHPELRPIALAGPGGKAGRVRRLLEHNRAREVRVERVGIAEELGLPACAGGLFLRAGRACDEERPCDRSVAQLLRTIADEIGHGSPSAVGALALVGFRLGESLFRVGEAGCAVEVLLAAVPRDLLPSEPLHFSALRDVPPLRGPSPRFARPAALGDPARNLYLAGVIHAIAGDMQPAAALLRAAAREGLPEALNDLERASLH